jgi:hypothetical protein
MGWDKRSPRGNAKVCDFGEINRDTPGGSKTIIDDVPFTVSRGARVVAKVLCTSLVYQGLNLGDLAYENGPTTLHHS